MKGRLFVACCVAGVLALVVGTVKFALYVRSRVVRELCMQNMQELVKSLFMYTMDSSEDYPRSLQDIYPYLQPDADRFICPAQRHRSGDPLNVQGWTDYAYITGRTASDFADTVLIFCPPANHGEEGAVVGTVDGAVSWCPIRQFIAMTNTPGFFYGERYKQQVERSEACTKVIYPRSLRERSAPSLVRARLPLSAEDATTVFLRQVTNVTHILFVSTETRTARKSKDGYDLIASIDDPLMVSELIRSVKLLASVPMARTQPLVGNKVVQFCQKAGRGIEISLYDDGQQKSFGYFRGKYRVSDDTYAAFFRYYWRLNPRNRSDGMATNAVNKHP